MSAEALGEWALERADELGLEMEIDFEKEGGLRIDWIANPVSRNAASAARDAERRKGADFMRSLVENADRLGVALSLRAMNGNPVLIDFYARFGFVLDEATWSATDPKMVRMPETPEASRDAEGETFPDFGFETGFEDPEIDRQRARSGFKF